MILRPGLVLAPAVYGGTAMLRGLAGLPFVTPVIEPGRAASGGECGRRRAAVAHSLTPDAKLNVKWDVAHPDVLTLAAVVSATRDWLGFRRRPIGGCRAGSARWCRRLPTCWAILAGEARRVRPRSGSWRRVWWAHRALDRRDRHRAEKP